MKPRGPHVILLLVVTALAGAGVWVLNARRGDGAPAEPGAVSDVVFAVYEGDVSLLVYLAHDWGYFRDNGLNVTLKAYEAGTIAADEMLGGGADVATAGELVFVTNLPQYPDLRFFGTVSDFRLDKLIARRDKGIQFPEDLRGKRIGVLHKATSEFFLGRFLTLHGLSYDDVEIVYLNPGEIVTSLLAGTIDAGQTWDPNIFRLKLALKDGAVVFPTKRGFESTETFLLITRESWLDENAETARRLLEALVRAERFVTAAPEEARAFMAARFYLTHEYAAYVYPKIAFKVELSQVLLMVMDNETRWAMEQALAPFQEFPNYLDYMYVDALHAVDPEAITVIR